MGEIHDIFGGKKLTPEEIEKLKIEQAKVEPVGPDEHDKLVQDAQEAGENMIREQEETISIKPDEIWHPAGEIAKKIVEDLKIDVKPEGSIPEPESKMGPEPGSNFEVEKILKKQQKLDEEKDKKGYY